jgi:hypothetical protein
MEKYRCDDFLDFSSYYCRCLRFRFCGISSSLMQLDVQGRIIRTPAKLGRPEKDAGTLASSQGSPVRYRYFIDGAINPWIISPGSLT